MGDEHGQLVQINRPAEVSNGVQRHALLLGTIRAGDHDQRANELGVTSSPR